ncbi:MAG: toprim domain-containing protein, partial [Acidimicrobiaceae bacterium]|nr:toprim domain-containing protein [Acidimicrobiaceae bacterium]
FIVEGDSAGGSAVRARHPETQAILPIRGKILNVERARIDRMLKNNEIQAIIAAIGAGIGDPAGSNGSNVTSTNGSSAPSRESTDDGCDIDKARYHKVIVLADADVDGSHIRTLLLTFFYRQMRPLVEAGYVYVAQPPLYSTKVSNSKTVYLLDDAAREAFLAARPKHNREFQRLKGLGEMDWDELRSTTMDPGTRSLLQVSVEEAAIADQVISVLMGDDVELRKNFIVTNAREVRNLDF